MTTQIDWRETLCQFLGISSGTDDVELVETLQSAAEQNQPAQHSPSPSSSANPQAPQSSEYQIIYRLLCSASQARVPGLYLEAPWVVNSGPYGAHLRASSEIALLELYLERHKDLRFIVYKDYNCCGPQPPREETHSDPASYLTGQSVCVVSEEFLAALDQLSEQALQDVDCPEFEMFEELHWPYLWWYQGRRAIAATLPTMDPLLQTHVHPLQAYLEEVLGRTYGRVDSLLEEGKITAEYLSYLYVSTRSSHLSIQFTNMKVRRGQAPDQILISKLDGETSKDYRGFHCQSWLESSNRKPLGPLSGDQPGYLTTASWSFDGNFQRNETVLRIDDLPSLSEPFNIRSLKVYPLEFADEETKQLLRARGEMFWICRKRAYVCCNKELDMPINAVVSLSEHGCQNQLN
jgi:hypothetical protein